MKKSSKFWNTFLMMVLFGVGAGMAQAQERSVTPPVAKEAVLNSDSTGTAGTDQGHPSSDPSESARMNEADPLKAEFPYLVGTAIPTGYHLESRIRSRSLVAGCSVFALAWAPMLVLGSGGYPEIAIPLIGPFAGAARSTSSASLFVVGSGSLFTAIFIADGILQTGSAAMILWSLTHKQEWVIRNKAFVSRFTVAPIPIGSGYGVGTVGTF